MDKEVGPPGIQINVWNAAGKTNRALEFRQAIRSPSEEFKVKKSSRIFTSPLHTTILIKA